MTTKNAYYLCWPEQPPKSWCPFGDRHPDWVRTRYYGRVFQHLEENLHRGGFTVYLTSSTEVLPSYGDDVIAVVDENERCQIPAYADDIFATFTCYGTQEELPFIPAFRATRRNLIATGSYLYNAVRRAPAVMKRKLGALTGGEDALPAIYTIPLGYANQVDLPIKPIEDRTTDVFFAGSVSHRANDSALIRDLMSGPKDLSRRELTTVLETLSSERSAIRVKLNVKTDFRESLFSSAEEYSRSMMNAKICPIPRGKSLESFRFFEALRYGCIPIVETLPSRRFYDGSPAISINTWEELHTLIPDLLADTDALQERHEAVLNWWHTRCSEEAVGRYMADNLNIQMSEAVPVSAYG